jgi:hypothetical protein
MAVLVEAISVVVRRDAIDEKLPGGWETFVEEVSNNTLCTDGTLARVGFMTPEDVEEFMRFLAKGGLTFVKEGKAIDVAVVDQMRGPTTPAEWLEFAHIPCGNDGGEVAACWLFEGPRVAAGVHVPSMPMNLAVPDEWRYEESLSANSLFVPTEEAEERLQFRGHDNGVDVYIDRTTGKKAFVGRTYSEPKPSLFQRVMNVLGLNR